jgi:hypothetical protein
MPWSCDRTGFPVLELPALKLGVHLLPVAKAQFERFLAAPVRQPLGSPQAGLYGDVWYEKLLEVSPRVTPHAARITDVEAMFMAGVLPAEINRFAGWLGDGFDLPTTETWREVDAAIRDEPLSADEVAALRSDSALHRQARAAIDAIVRLRDPATWGQLMMLEGGLLEWVRTGPQTLGGLGRPQSDFQKMILNPQRDAPVRPVREGRYKYFGFRLVRPM